MGWKSCLSLQEGCHQESPLLSCSHCSLHCAVVWWTLRLWGEQYQKLQSLLIQCSLPEHLQHEASPDGTLLQFKCLDLTGEAASASKSYILPHLPIYTRSCNSSTLKGKLRIRGVLGIEHFPIIITAAEVLCCQSPNTHTFSYKGTLDQFCNYHCHEHDQHWFSKVVNYKIYIQVPQGISIRGNFFTQKRL